MAKKSQARKVKQSRRGKKKYSINWTKIPNLPGAKKKKGGDGSAAAAEAGPKGESSAASRQIGSVVRAMGRAKTKKELNELTKKAKSLVSKMKRPSSQSKAKGKIKGAKSARESSIKQLGGWKKAKQTAKNAANMAGAFIPGRSPGHMKLQRKLNGKKVGASKKRGKRG